MARRFNLTLEMIMDTMDVPRQRKVPATIQNTRWLIRNLGIRNSGVVGYELAMSILRSELTALEGK